MSLATLRRTIGGVRVSNLFDVPGKPFGWAHHEERRLIRAHLDRKHGRLEPHSWDWTIRELGRVAQIQRRLHRYDKSFRELQTIYRAAKPVAVADSPEFTLEELAHLAEHFAMANDPVAASIAAKAAAAIAAVEG